MIGNSKIISTSTIQYLVFSDGVAWYATTKVFTMFYASDYLHDYLPECS